MQGLMSRHVRPAALAAVLGLAACGGCMEKSAEMSARPASGGSAVTATPTTMPAADAAMPKPADMTHTMMADAPYFMSMPTAAAKPDGMMKSGSKVLVMVPGSRYSKVMSEKGMTMYVSTSALDPIGK